MSQFFEKTMQGLLEAVAISKGEISLIEKTEMPATTFIVTKPRRKAPRFSLGDIRRFTRNLEF